jgi:hypothetical protein
MLKILNQGPTPGGQFNEGSTSPGHSHPSCHFSSGKHITTPSPPPSAPLPQHVCTQGLVNYTELKEPKEE